MKRIHPADLHQNKISLQKSTQKNERYVLVRTTLEVFRLVAKGSGKSEVSSSTAGIEF
jgi:hypothetical protein